MPDYFSHVIAAEKIFEGLGAADKLLLKNKTLYTLGALGADVFFMYNYKLTKTNLGRDLHRRNAEELFYALKGANSAYAAGYATHYALDCTLHPAVYAYESAHRHPLAHQRFENDLGLFISKYFGIRRTIMPRERLLENTFAVYDAIKLIEPDVTVTGIERCLKRHFAYTRWLYKTKKQTYVCEYDFFALAGAVEEAVELGIRCVKCVLSGDIDGGIFNKEFLQR